MSRPAITIPPPAARSRWRAEQGGTDLGDGRHRGHGGIDRGAADIGRVVDAIDEDACETSGRIGRELDLVDEADDRVGSGPDTPRASASHVTARYSRPVSQNR